MDSVSPAKKAKPPSRPGSIPKIFIRGAAALGRKPKPRSRPGKDSLQIPRVDGAWFDARLDMIGLNRHMLSVEFDRGSKNWLRKIIDGERRCQIAEVAWLADKLRVSGSDVIRALGYELPGADVPIIGVVEEDSRVTVLAETKRETTIGPPGSEVHTVAIACKLTRGPLKFLNAQILFYSPIAHTVQLGAIGRLAVFEVKSDPRPYLGVAERAGVSSVELTLMNGSTVRLQQLVAATPVQWTKTV